MTDARPSAWSPSALLARVSRLELVVALVVGCVLVALVALEPGILEAPFENSRTLAFTLGGTAAAAVALVVMLRLGVPPGVRVVVLGVPFLAVGWWLVSPFFIDEHVDDEFAVSIADAATTTTMEPTAAAERSTTTGLPTTAPSTTEPSTTTASPTTVPPAGPVLLGSGSLRGLAGHSGTGVAGVFALEDGSRVVRLEDIAIQNGPDLHLYVVPGLGRTDPVDGSLYLGPLRGNVGNLTYDLPPDAVGSGDWTVLVWCDAFSVEFVGADVTVL